MDQVSDDCLVVVESPLETLQRHIHLGLSESGHDTGLAGRGLVDCIVGDPVQVGVYRPLVHPVHLIAQELLPLPDDSLGIPLTGLVDLSVSSVILGCLDQLRDFGLLLAPEEFL